MAATITLTRPPVGSRAVAPRLENGDRLTRAEFERRYLAMPDLKKAELIEGMVHMPSPVSRPHATAHADLTTWLVNEQRLEWWEWREGEYVSLPVERGVIRSRVFPGLWLEVAALVEGRSADVLARLERGLRSEEYTAFAARLGSRVR